MKLFLILGLPFMTRWEEPHPVHQEESVILRRWVYPEAREGTDKAIHNQAVAAEQAGDLEMALELSQEAYVSRPRRRGLAYIERLEERIAGRSAMADLVL
jgi:hypothetical protein